VKSFTATLALVLVVAGSLAPRTLADETQAPPTASRETGEPLDLGTSEKTTVRLVLIDVMVVDRHGRTVPDLTLDDFEIRAAGDLVPVETMDIDCPSGAIDDPESVSWAAKREATPARKSGRKIVLTMDYLHSSPLQREFMFDQASAMIKNGASAEDEIMLAALTGGLRVEQTLTNDREKLLRSLKRMRYDISLWNGNFFHINEYGFVNGLMALFDVLGSVPGPKAVVLYSAMLDVPLDLQFTELAAIAASSRCSIYPVDLWGLRTIEEDRLVRAGGG